MVDIKGRWALITGASRGIGYLAALFLAERGCNLILHGRKEKHLGHVLKKSGNSVFRHMPRRVNCRIRTLWKTC